MSLRSSNWDKTRTWLRLQTLLGMLNLLLTNDLLQHSIHVREVVSIDKLVHAHHQGAICSMLGRLPAPWIEGRIALPTKLVSTPSAAHVVTAAVLDDVNATLGAGLSTYLLHIIFGSNVLCFFAALLGVPWAVACETLCCLAVGALGLLCLRAIGFYVRNAEGMTAVHSNAIDQVRILVQVVLQKSSVP